MSVLLWLAVLIVAGVAWLACWQIRALTVRMEGAITRIQGLESDMAARRLEWAETTIQATEAKLAADIAQQIASATCRYAFTPIGRTPS